MLFICDEMFTVVHLLLAYLLLFVVVVAAVVDSFHFEIYFISFIFLLI